MHRVNALAVRGEEGRSSLRKPRLADKRAMIRGYPNGETRRVRARHGMLNK